MTIRRRGGLSRTQATVLDFPLHVLPPGLLTDPAHASAAFDHLEGRKIAGMIVNRDESSWMEELQNVPVVVAA